MHRNREVVQALPRNNPFDDSFHDMSFFFLLVACWLVVAHCCRVEHSTRKAFLSPPIDCVGECFTMRHCWKKVLKEFRDLHKIAVD